MTRFCPICGKSDSDVDFHGELCLKCAKIRIKPLPQVKVSVCKKCGEVIGKGRKKKGMTPADEISRLLKLKNAKPKYSTDFTSVEYDMEYGRMEQPITVLIEKPVCADCGRASTQYFEAIIQLRGNEKKVERTAALLIRRIEQKSFIPKIDELKEGLDLYCGSRSEAIAALNFFSLPFRRTEKLAGERDGKRLYRTTLLVRF